MNKFDTEKTVGIQLRIMSRDVAEEFRNDVMKKLYTYENGTVDEISEACYEWHWNISSYFMDQSKVEEYVNLIELAFKKRINLNKFEPWKKLMRREMGSEFFKMMDKFTQVPQLAARNKGFVKVEREDSNPWV